MAAPFHFRKQVPKTLISAAVEYDHKHRFTPTSLEIWGVKVQFATKIGHACPLWLCPLAVPRKRSPKYSTRGQGRGCFRFRLGSQSAQLGLIAVHEFPLDALGFS